MAEIKVVNVTQEELFTRLDKLLNEKLEALSQHFQSEKKELLTTDEAKKLLGTTEQNLINKRKSGKIKAYRLEGRVYYKKQELIDALDPIKLSNDQEGSIR